MPYVSQQHDTPLLRASDGACNPQKLAFSDLVNLSGPLSESVGEA
jgi:hypothetical protein